MKPRGWRAVSAVRVCVPTCRHHPIPKGDWRTAAEGLRTSETASEERLTGHCGRSEDYMHELRHRDPLPPSSAVIPDAIDNLAALEKLDLSNNQISGKAVRQDRSSAIRFPPRPQ